MDASREVAFKVGCDVGAAEILTGSGCCPANIADVNIIDSTLGRPSAIMRN